MATGAYTMPSAIYIGLSTGSFGDDASGTELNGNGYTRKVMAFDAAVAGTADNSGAVEFSAATASWGTVSHFGLFDASSVATC